jgi:predicted AlkP superfamily pyrophosphatase or phosphodiesterase
MNSDLRTCIGSSVKKISYLEAVMKSTSRVLILVCSIVLLLPRSSPAQSTGSSVLLVSFDGFRHDYIDKHDLRNFKAFRAAGSAAEGLIPCYPTLTFPNHYSIVTGMRPSTHGLVDNSFYDSALNLQYGTGKRELVQDPRFYGGIPLWTLAKQSGLKTASYFWVGSETTDQSRQPDKYFLYDARVPFRTQVDSVLAWLNKKDSERPRLVMLYFSEPDHTSHQTGPYSPETHAILLEMDSVLGYLMDGLRKIKTPVNTILVSDHGMADLVMEDETFVFVDELYDIRSKKVRTVVSSSLAHLYINDKPTLDSMYTLLKSKEGQYKVYRKRELPKQLEYGNHYRIGDLVLMAAPAHTIRYDDRKGNSRDMEKGSHFGVHGYDPTVVTDVRGIFLAQGPQIKQGQKLGLVRNIDIYPLVARILGLKIPKIDGDPKALEKMVK